MNPRQRAISIWLKLRKSLRDEATNYVTGNVSNDHSRIARRECVRRYKVVRMCSIVGCWDILWILLYVYASSWLQRTMLI